MVSDPRSYRRRNEKRNDLPRRVCVAGEYQRPTDVESINGNLQIWERRSERTPKNRESANGMDVDKA